LKGIQSGLLALLASLAFVRAIGAESAPFDLAGPTLEVRVTRGERTLPISEVPDLAAGDRIWIKADLPATQSAHYLMVLAFLEGSTNPPPANWFFRCETWAGQCAQQGLTVTVPPDAQQVILFLAPETGGDFKTLVNAVRGRPGAFVRASQDLNQASLDRARLEAYLHSIRELGEADQTRLRQATPLLARSLAIKVNDKCLDRLPELQAPCLMQGQESLILNDGHSTSIVEALTTGPASDLALEASSTPQMGYGYYSPYIASVLDIARIMGSFHTAQYQYIPALASQADDRMALTLNTPPSFHNPKSVLVAALPAVEHPQLPPLHAVDPKEIYCARKAALVLPVEGAPLVFSTGYAHEMALSLTGKDGKAVDLPARADPEQGGLLVDTSALGGVALGDSMHASLHGYWGFERYAGPGFELVNTHAAKWELRSDDTKALIVGREDTVHLQAASASCLDNIMLRDPQGKELKAQWKKLKPDEVEVTLPLQQASPGPMTLLLSQYGSAQALPVSVHAFAEAGHLESFTLHAGDSQGTLSGTRLDEVATLSLNGVAFQPTKLSRAQGSDVLLMSAADPATVAALHQGDSAVASVTLKDGRALELKAVIDAPRPSVALIGKSVQPSASSTASHIELVDENELPQDALLAFSVRAQSPAAFARDEKLEVATTDEAFSTTLSLANGGITLENAQVAVATLDPRTQFGASAAGPLQFRAIANGVAGDWQPLAKLVRLPQLKDLQCPATPDAACKLSGSKLYLVESLSTDPQFTHAVQVPDGFPGYALPVPRPTNGELYVRLRDDPAAINRAALEVPAVTPPPATDPKAPPAAADPAPPNS
jgi:hypothetical protein